MMDTKHKMVSVEYSWERCPKFVLEQVFSYLPLKDLRSAQRTCSYWYNVSKEEYSWMKRFRRDFNVAADKGIATGATSWFHEYKRLSRHVPTVKVQHLKFTHTVLSVEFSPDGKMFTTCTSNGLITIWRSDHPIQIIAKINMKDYGWINPSLALFNTSNTLLFIFGFLLENQNRTVRSVVYSIPDKVSLNFTINSNAYFLNPWFCDDYILSEDVTRQDGSTETNFLYSTICLVKANSGVSFIPFYKVRNMTFPPVFNLLMANCIDIDVPTDIAESSRNDIDNSANDVTGTKLSCFYNKLLIYTSCLKSYFPHAIAFKKFRNMEFFKSINPDLTIEEIFAFRSEHPVGDTYDTADKVIDLNGCIMDMRMCPSNRYLFTNSRKFLNSRPEDPHMEVPKMGSEIDFHKIDLITFEVICKPFHGLAGSPEYNFDMLGFTVSKNYIASGSEFRRGCIWDRHYDIPIAHFEADSLMDIIALNPTNQEMLIANISDNDILVYRSPEEVKKINNRD